MTQDDPRFSRRLGVRERRGSTLIYHDAPQELRVGLHDILLNTIGLEPHRIREWLCRSLRKWPNHDNWSSPNITNEINDLLRDAKWYEIYDFLENCSEALSGYATDTLEESINSLFADENIGWRLSGDKLEIHSPGTGQEVLDAAIGAIASTGLSVATQELREAHNDLARRPSPDLTGAVQHAMAAMESLVRSITDDPKPTLGALLDRHSDLFPQPIDDVTKKLWGFASNNARHGSERSNLEWDEAVLVVHVVSSLCSYLITKFEDDLPGTAI